MSGVGQGLLVVVCDPAPGQEAELERWYEDVHLYERSSVPGVLFSRRYTNVNGQPHSIVLYDVETPAVLQSEAYLVGGRANALIPRLAADASPDAAPGLGRTINRIRNEYELLCSAGRHPGELGAYVRLVREEAGADHEQALNDWYEQEHLPAVAKLLAVRGVKRYRALAGSPAYLTLYELSNQAVLESDAWKKTFETPSAAVRKHLTTEIVDVAQYFKVIYPHEALAETGTWT